MKPKDPLAAIGLLRRKGKDDRASELRAATEQRARAERAESDARTRRIQIEEEADSVARTEVERAAQGAVRAGDQVLLDAYLRGATVRRAQAVVVEEARARDSDAARRKEHESKDALGRAHADEQAVERARERNAAARLRREEERANEEATENVRRTSRKP